MSQQLATLAFACAIAGMFYLIREPKAKTSPALWLPVIWLAIASSRNISEWLQPDIQSKGGLDTANRYLDGNPIDRNVMTGLLFVGILVLIGRRQKILGFLRANQAILLFFFYCLVSTLWADHPDVSFKRWTKAVGDFVMVLIVLSDPDRISAIKRFFARAGFVLLPLSILFIRYYSDLGRRYSPWDGALSYTGVTTNKNELGMICMIYGLASLWCLLDAYGWGTNTPKKFTPMIAHSGMILMGVWLILTANSMTPFSCMVLAGFVMIWVGRPAVRRRPALIHLAVFGVLFVAFSALFLNLGSGLLSNIGRDATLTGRTAIWNMVIAMCPNRLIGAGFESFWMGDRLAQIWRIYWNHPNQAHDGYLEIYLNLGWIGEGLLALVIISGYRTVISKVRRNVKGASLMLGYFVAAVAYNFTESAFKMTHPVWIVFLLAMTAVPVQQAVKQLKVSQPKETQELNSELLAAKVL
jgi:exopolysaccharide production protein ExoQ